MANQPRKSAPPALGKPGEPVIVEAAAPPAAADPLVAQQDRDNFAVAAMVAAGLTEDQARAALALAREEPAAVVEAVSDAPLCPHGCHGQSWFDVAPDLAGVSCEHGSFLRNPGKAKEK